MGVLDNKMQKEIFFSNTYSISLSYSAKSLKIREDSEQKGYGIRVYKDGNLGFSFANDEKDIKKAIENAAKVSKYSPRKNFSFPYKTKLIELDLVDDAIKNIDAVELKSLLEQVREGAEKYGGNSQIFIDRSISFERLENDNGFFGEYETTELSISVEVMDEDGYGFFSNSFGHLKDIQDFTALGEHAAEMAKKMKHPKKPESASSIVIFKPEAVASLFDILLPAFNGDLKRRKISFLHDKEGKKIFSDKFSLHHEPLIPYSPLSAPFDGDGIAALQCALVEKGVLKNFAYNLEISSLEGIKKSGFAVRSSYTAPPGIGFSNLVVDKGDLENDLYPSISIVAFHGVHTANTTTGDFGVEVSIAFRNMNGEEEPLRGFMIVGNIFNLFMDIYGIGKVQKNINGIITPKIAFSDVRVVPS